jgi:hypothetical protein
MTTFLRADVEMQKRAIGLLPLANLLLDGILSTLVRAGGNWVARNRPPLPTEGRIS